MNEERMITESLSTYQTTFGDARDKNISLYQLGNNNECAVYLPDNITADTKMMVYYPGSGLKQDWYSTENGYAGAQNYLMENGSDSIVIMPYYPSHDSAKTEIAIEMIDTLRNEYGITSEQVQFSGFSAGAEASLEATARYIEQHPEAGPQVCVAIDGYGRYTDSSAEVSNNISDAFTENGTILIAIDSNGKDSSYLKNYANAGINVIRAEYQGDGSVDMIDANGNVRVVQNNHIAINQSYFKEEINDFVNGTGKLPEGYKYQRFDASANDGKGAWIDVDASHINTYKKMNQYFGNNVTNIKDPITSVSSQGNNNNVYADLSAINEWSNKLNGINDSLISVLSSLEKTIESLTDSFEGNFSKGFIDDSTKIVNSAQAQHNEMYTLINDLKVISNIYNEQ